MAQLLDWLRIPSISTAGDHRAELRLAAEWVCERVRSVGGSAALDENHGGNPLAIGELRAQDPKALRC